MPTPDETEGPFYPVKDQNDKDADLTQIEGHTGVAHGQYIIVSGQVQDVTGHSIANAVLDIWQPMPTAVTVIRVIPTKLSWMKTSKDGRSFKLMTKVSSALKP